MFSAAFGFRKDVSLFVMNRITAMDDVSGKNLLQLSASTFVELVDSISEVVVEQAEDNPAHLNDGPVFLLHPLATILFDAFSDIVLRQQQRPKYT